MGTFDEHKRAPSLSLINVPLECSEAEATFRELLATINDRTWPVRTYTCGVLGAGEQEQYGYVITCDDAARGAKIVLGK
ncbi:hypothetical protein [Rhodococcus sp. AH-ZY2]|uniref:hypothetical protein n=1 Tax=Rhodococcus sp. AH-ZY2 TaxID=3047468 RepID=UPI0027DF7106|nr:hypothetical protein [Rhodococcus sp. AH-ZY2]WML60893.1 hypothetical protein QNA09_00630 [Rhodococcus sp. AH-ZY2]